MYSIFMMHRGKWVWVWSYKSPSPHELTCIAAYSRHPLYQVILGL